MVPPIFVRFSLILVPTYSEKLIRQAPTVKSFEILEASFEGVFQRGTRFRTGSSPF